MRLSHIGLNESGAVKITFLSRPGTAYTIEYTDSLSGGQVWQPFANNGTLTATETVSEFTDDFTANTSGSLPPAGTRFYRFLYDETL